MTQQPDRLEAGDTPYSCGECGFHFLDRLFIEEYDGDSDSFLACSGCGWTSERPPEKLALNEWYTGIYGG